MSKLEFTLHLTEEQKQFCNSYLNSSDNIAWIHDSIVSFDNIRDYSFTVHQAPPVLGSLEDGPWETHKWHMAETPDPLTLDLASLPNIRDTFTPSRN
jgi:hypothetical protein